MTSSLLDAPPIVAPVPVPGPRLRAARYEPGQVTDPDPTPSAPPVPRAGPDGRPPSTPAPNPPAPPPPTPPPPPIPPPTPTPTRAAAPPGPDTAAPTAADQVTAHRAAVRHLRLALEVFDGRRPPAHLAGHVTPPVLRYWRAAGERRRAREPTRFSRLRLCLPGRDVAEVAVTCRVDGRPRALAARFERSGGRWLCTAVRLG